jgi:lipoprotein-anchoring transpeptidase ErfK/SrfK
MSNDRVSTFESKLKVGSMTRRVFMLAAPVALAGCAQTTRMQSAEISGFPQPYASYRSMYGPILSESHPVAPLDIGRVDPVWLRQDVAYGGPERPGTVVVDPDERHLYLVRTSGRALRYGVGVGREGFDWSGRAVVKHKSAWPTWTPPAEMVARDPRARPWANGMPGGPDNPLGARAMYLFQGDRDTLYRIHGTSEPWTIGSAVSSGCVRMFNHDVIDLYRRVPVGTTVVVRPTSVA